MTEPVDEALEALRTHFASLAIGTHTSYDVCFSEGVVAEYATRTQIAYPGRNLDRAGARIVPPGMLFVGPTVVFGLKDGPRGAMGGIFTDTNRRYLGAVHLGETVRFEASVTGKFLRRGRYYIEVTWRAFLPSGAEAASGKEVHTLGMVREPQP